MKHAVYISSGESVRLAAWLEPTLGYPRKLYGGHELIEGRGRYLRDFLKMFWIEIGEPL